MSIRRQARILALNALYQSELNDTLIMEKFSLLCENFEVNKKSLPYANKLLLGISEHKTVLNSLIGKNAVNWRLDRMALVDRNIMLIAVFEICYQDDVPPSVVINEAVEIAKQYCADGADGFINGILDAINKSLMDVPKITHCVD